MIILNLRLSIFILKAVIMKNFFVEYRILLQNNDFLSKIPAWIIFNVKHEQTIITSYYYITTMIIKS